MAVEHAHTPWSEWLKQVSAARGTNVKVIGQPIEDLMRATATVADMTHLSPPIDLIEAGFSGAQIAVVGQQGRLELLCVRPTWVYAIDQNSDAVVEVLDLPVLVGHVLPGTNSRYSGVPADLVAIGANAAAPQAGAYGMATGLGHDQMIFGRFFVPRGKIWSITNTNQNFAVAIGIRWQEIPETR